LLRMLRGGRRWLTALIVIGVGGVFVVFLGLQGPMSFSTSRDVVRVGPYQFGTQEFERVRARREAMLQDQLGDQFDARALRDALDDVATRELVQEGLLASAAEEMGLQVTKREIEQLVLSEPGFRDEGGRFDRERFEAFAEYNYGSQRAFMEDRRLALLAAKMVSLLSSQPEVSPGEAREVVRRELEEVRIATVEVGIDSDGEAPEIGEEAIQEVLTTRPDQVAQRYHERNAEFNRPERVRARHILRSVSRDASPEEVAQAKADIEAAAARIAAGEAFEDVAREVSQDPGSQANGGDLGFFARGQMVPDFERAAFALQPGEISEPVRTDFGFHLIRVEEREEAVSRPLEEVREQIAADLLREEALRDRARAEADRLAAAIRGGQSLKEAGAAQGLEVSSDFGVRRSPNGFVPGLGAAPELLAAAFALEPGESSPEVFEVGDRFALVQVVERSEPTEEQIDERVEAKREELLEAKRNLRTQSWLDAREAALRESGDLVVNTAAIERR